MKKTRTVLIVDDHEINRTILSKILVSEYQLLFAENGKQALEILRQKKNVISAVLLDLAMPIIDGYQVLEEVQKDKWLSQIPIIVSTQQDWEGNEVRCLGLGAADFLTKPYRPDIIRHRLANTIHLRETSALINATKKDDLTGVYNKPYFYQEAADILKTDPDTAYSIICTDIARFKLVNDIYGEEVGDKVLQFLAKILNEIFERIILIGRLSGDNFVLLIPEHKKRRLDLFREANERLNEFPIVLNMVLRFGIYPIQDTAMPVSVMCDRALLAIRGIKNRYETYFAYYDESLRDRILAEQHLVDDMQKALKNNEFQVFYQPKYDLNSEKIVGAEALIRWKNEQNREFSPQEFIPLFEKNGFIVDLDIYIWETVCKFLRSCMDKGNHPVPVSINISRMDVFLTDVPAVLKKLTQKYDIVPQMLHLEITESGYSENPEYLVQIFTQLHDMGFIIEMDDFGTGYSSLNMLGELPIDIVKLDMKFIQGETKKAKERSILGFIVSMAKWLRLQIVAEGVETAEQATILKRLGCDFVQGFYFSRAIPQEEFWHRMLAEFQQEAQQQSHNLQLELEQNVYFPSTHMNMELVMIIDENLDTRRKIRKTLQTRYDVLEADNDISAMDLIDTFQEKIKVILLSYAGPGMTGLQLLPRLKMQENLKQIPVIVLLEHNTANEVQVLSMGADEFVAHPCQPTVLFHRIEQVGKHAEVKKKEAILRKM